MKVIDAVAEILKREGVEFLACYPTTPIIEAVTGVRSNNRHRLDSCEGE